MKIIIYLITFLSYLPVIAQQFSFELYFEDAVGNKDTLILGYDPMATDSIDPLFGELNIINDPLNSVFDVRITDEFTNNLPWINNPATFHTKKQISSFSCEGPIYPLSAIDIKAKYWPVTASWDRTLFHDSCRTGSLLTSISPGGWWDTDSPSNLQRVVLVQQNEVTFTSQISISPNGSINHNYGYVNDNNDTLSVFWQSFGDLGLIWVNIDEKESSSINIYPNPVNDHLYIDIESNQRIRHIRIINYLGEVFQLKADDRVIDLSNLPNGLYTIVLSLRNGQEFTKKIIKTAN